MRRSYPLVLAIASILLIGDRAGSSGSGAALARFGPLHSIGAPAVERAVVLSLPRPAGDLRSKYAAADDHRCAKGSRGAADARRMHPGAVTKASSVDLLPSTSPAQLPSPCVDSSSVSGESTTTPGVQAGSPQDVATGARF